MKLVLIIDQDLPIGLKANTAAVLGLSLGNRIPGLVGPDVQDRDGSTHLGITSINIPVLAAANEEIKSLREQLFANHDNVTVIDFNQPAQQSKDYQDYTKALKKVPSKELRYLGICLYGEDKDINKLTGNLKLLR